MGRYETKLGSNAGRLVYLAETRRVGNGTVAVSGKRSGQRAFGSIATCLPGMCGSAFSPAGTAQARPRE